VSEPPVPRRPYLEGEPIPPQARPRSEQDDPTYLRVPDSRRAEALTAGLLVLAGLAGIGFVVAYLATDSTPWLGATLGAAFGLLGAALVVAGRAVVPQEIVIEPRRPVEHPQEEHATAELLRLAGRGVSRRRLLWASAAFAVTGIGASAIAAAGSLGPWIGRRSIPSPWRRGLALVDEHGHPIRADQLAVGSFVTAFPAGVDTDRMGAPVMVVRIDPAKVELPAARNGWAPHGILAYSKICTHAGCAVAMLRYPLFTAHSATPALVCPCHYSTFDVATGGTVLFGPAGRPLPQLPIEIAGDGSLRAGGPLSGDVGPAWLGVDRG
jgi:ubiquinol-cytochrome c reductase iron-sulfur subunit